MAEGTGDYKRAKETWADRVAQTFALAALSSLVSGTVVLLRIFPWVPCDLFGWIITLFALPIYLLLAYGVGEMLVMVGYRKTERKWGVFEKPTIPGMGLALLWLILIGSFWAILLPLVRPHFTKG